MTDDRPPRLPKASLIIKPGDPSKGPLLSLRVADGTQINYLGTLHHGGETFTAPRGAATVWLAAGWVTEVPKGASTSPKPARAGSRR